MRIVFIMRSVGYLRNYEWVIRRFAERGHVVLLYFDREKKAVDRMQESSDKVAQDHLDVIVAEHPKVKYHNLHNAYSKPIGLVTVASRRIRLVQDYARYFEPQFANAAKLRERAGSFLKPASRWMVRMVARLGWTRRGLIRALGGLETMIRPRADVVRFIRQAKADILLVTPLLGHGSSQIEYFKAAAALGVKTCLPVASWDNLTSKGLMQCEPGSVLVWNHAQKQEAVDMHGIPPEKVVVTGAHCYEHWFTWKPATTKDAFLAKVGLKPGKDYVVFLGSSRFIAEDETPVVLKWVEAIRNAKDPAVRGLGILIRPHPQNYGVWTGVDLARFGNVVLFPTGDSNHNPVSTEAKSEYFDTMYHCSAVVGVNTSGLIEAAILNKPVHTVLFEEMAMTQEGTLHFHHLATDRGGLLRVAKTLDDHVALLGACLRDPQEDLARSKAFVESFVWPRKIGSKTMVGAFVNAVTHQLDSPQLSRRKSRFRTKVGRVLASPLLLIYLPEHLRLSVRRVVKHRQNLAAKARAAAQAQAQGGAQAQLEGGQ